MLWVFYWLLMLLMFDLLNSFSNFSVDPPLYTALPPPALVEATDFLSPSFDLAPPAATRSVDLLSFPSYRFSKSLSSKFSSPPTLDPFLDLQRPQSTKNAYFPRGLEPCLPSEFSFLLAAPPFSDRFGLEGTVALPVPPTLILLCRMSCALARPTEGCHAVLSPG